MAITAAIEESFVCANSDFPGEAVWPVWPVVAVSSGRFRHSDMAMAMKVITGDFRWIIHFIHGLFLGTYNWYFGP